MSKGYYFRNSIGKRFIINGETHTDLTMNLSINYWQYLPQSVYSLLFYSEVLQIDCQMLILSKKNIKIIMQVAERQANN